MGSWTDSVYARVIIHSRCCAPYLHVSANALYRARARAPKREKEREGEREESDGKIRME